ALISRIPGSLGVATVGACTLIGAISGASTATVAVVGKTLYPGLIREGYGVRFASGLLSSSGSIDIMIPPSIAMILFGMAAEQSIAKLFAAGVLPGLLIAFMMSAYVVIMALRMRIPTRGKFDFARLRAATWDAGPALLMPVFVLAGIYLGWFSPTEAGGVACLSAILVGRYVYRDELERRARCRHAGRHHHRANPDHRRDRRAVLLDPDHQRGAANHYRRADGPQPPALGLPHGRERHPPDRGVLSR